MKTRYHQATRTPAERPRYFISDRPEAYEVWGEVSHDDARRLAYIIAEHAAKRFPGIEFCVDGEWHGHDEGMQAVSSFIDGHWQAWAAAMTAGQER